MKKALYIGIAVVVFIIFVWIFPKVNRRTITATVTKTERSIGNLDDNKSKDRLGKYLIYTMDEKGKAHVFENIDTWIWFKFNSSDVYAKIQQNKTYNFSIVGFRFPIFSMYPNIITVEEVNGANN
ncbi:DUF1523 family protein [Flammeovirga yaeyamensis]|uniref:DUF1523 family protein n=1 Tax=Flammeovirga yaeyamensis TaxID=367791 RepID=A0AAX1MZP1_9BACT|nr:MULTISPECIES: DUF1523 family protein [Flammeovirga]ANQ47991.1 DUF1523 family protein [Flammeovirga sp. MY04]MBB3700846.1 hypothetical protein [Flammeovirga yaeyamensis]NMF37954.1 DUF1523 family protein [Flammeovirga yaeyamensis]QWG00606.1 DUF1523 family protein [Flammeovirga yaeyamensis]